MIIRYSSPYKAVNTFRLAYRIIAVCSESNEKHINPLFGQKVKFLGVKPGGTSSTNQASDGHDFSAMRGRRIPFNQAALHALFTYKAASNLYF
jgi:hypothetical protein